MDKESEQSGFYSIYSVIIFEEINERGEEIEKEWGFIKHHSVKVCVCGVKILSVLQ